MEEQDNRDATSKDGKRRKNLGEFVFDICVLGASIIFPVFKDTVLDGR